MGEKYCGKDRIIDAFELYDILRELGAGLLKEDKPLSRATCISLLNSFDTNGSKRLSRQELKMLGVYKDLSHHFPTARRQPRWIF